MFMNYLFRSEKDKLKTYDTTKAMEFDGVCFKLPKQTQLEDSFTAMLDLFCLENEKDIEEKDKSYFSSLENSNWLTTMLSLLRISADVAENYIKVRFDFYSPHKSASVRKFMGGLKKMY